MHTTSSLVILYGNMNIHDVRQHIISMHIIKNRIGEERRKYAEKCADLTI